MRIGDMGGFEWIVILVVVLLVFGTGKVAEIGPALGRSIRGFREEVKKGDQKPAATNETKQTTAVTATTGAAATDQRSDDGKTGWF